MSDKLFLDTNVLVFTRKMSQKKSGCHCIIRKSAVIDFGQLGIGDPACDLAIAWTFFKDKSREVFRTLLPLDADTWSRGRAWTLWKTLIIAAGLTGTNPVEAEKAWHIIDEVLVDIKNSVLGSDIHVEGKISIIAHILSPHLQKSVNRKRIFIIGYSDAGNSGRNPPACICHIVA